MDKRRICFVSGTRAEYGLLYWLMKDVTDDPGFDLQLIVTGAHLEPEFGNTHRQIEDDGFFIDWRVPLGIDGDMPVDISKAMARALSGIGHALSELKPDLVMLLGDRYEILAAAQAAMLNSIPIGHIHGGELTEGAIDDSMRHAITKMSHLHFTAAEPYRQRVVQMGENPNNVYNVGAVGLDNIVRLPLLDRNELSESLNFQLVAPYFLVTFHPETVDSKESGRAVNELLAALDNFSAHRLVITGVNADPGYSQISAKLRAYAQNHSDRVLIRKSLGQLHYLSAMKHCAAVIGNSSSGIIEAPGFPVPTVNIGNRQKGRIRAESIFDCNPSRKNIIDAINMALSANLRDGIVSTPSLFNQGGASKKIMQVLKITKFEEIETKAFFDLPSQEII